MARSRLKLLSWAFRTVVALVALSAAGGIFALLVVTKPEPARSDRGDRAPRTIVMAAHPVAVRRQWQGYGTAKADISADVPARVTATVLELPAGVREGAWIDEGALLVQLDDRDFDRQVEIISHAGDDTDAQLARLAIEEKSWKARADLADEQVELARAEFDRVAEAQKLGVAKQREVDSAKQTLITAMRDQTATREQFDALPSRRLSLDARRLGQDAELRLARLNVERCRITSPLAGILQTVDVKQGESLAVGSRVARVVDLRVIEVPLRLPASARAHMRVGDEVILRTSGLVGEPVRAELIRIAPSDDESTRTSVAYIEVEQDPRASGGLAPGQFVRATVTARQSEERWVVPRRSVVGDRMLAIDDGHIVGRTIRVDFPIEAQFTELGVPDDQWVVLTDPLEAGTLVVASPTRNLTDGMAVTPVIAGEIAGDIGAGPEERR